LDAARLDELQAQAQYAQERYDLYKARAYGPRLTSTARLRELERESVRTGENLRFAKAQARREGAEADAIGADPRTEQPESREGP
jgi:hypothetical protein